MVSALLSACIVLYILAFPSSVLAATVSITSIPSDLTALTSFTLSASASGLIPNAPYFAKIRLGVSITSLTKGQTFNSSNDSPNDWLSDTDSYSLFSQIITDGFGNWSGDAIGRPSESSSVGDNYVVLRLRRTDNSTNYDSSGVLVHVSPAPTSMPTPTPTPTNTPTSTVAPSQTVTPLTVVATSTLTITSTRMVTSTPIVSGKIISTNVVEDPVILGVEDREEDILESSSTGKTNDKTNQTKSFIIALLFISAGIGLFAIASLLTKVDICKRKEKK